MFPQPQPGDDDRLGTGFALVYRGEMDSRLRTLASTLGATEVRVGSDGSGRAVSSWMDRHRARVVLVRPDRVVADYVGLGNGPTRESTWARALVGSRAAANYLDRMIEN
jgi:3-(3-hydroxy-phenyl)propionate hydroxylase